jgi:hypothetical protein
MKLIFNKQGKLEVTTSGAIPSSHDNDNYIIAELAEGEEFNFNYNYEINEEGFATRGELKEVDHEEVARFEAEIAATKYQRDRREAYPSFAQQFDTLYHGGYEAWKESIDSIKTQFPKPN